MNNQSTVCINLQSVFVPVMTLEQFAEHTGIKLDTVKGMRKAGKLPILDKPTAQGKVLIDMVELLKTYPRMLF